MKNIRNELKSLCDARTECFIRSQQVTKLWPKIVAELLKRESVSLRTYAKRLGISPTYLSWIGTGKVIPSERVESLLTEEYCK